MKPVLYIAVFLFSASAFAQQMPLVPRPAQFIDRNATFTLSQDVPLVFAGKYAEQAALFLQRSVLKYTGISLPVLPAAKGGRGIIIRQVVQKSDNPEAYELDMDAKVIRISAVDGEGLFNGVISLLQLIRKSEVQQNRVVLHCWNIYDSPRYSWRGFMLDESRHFFGKEKVKSILDWMAFYKLNRFHWHLTDQQGWRIEIKKYPKLALIGGIGDYTDENAPSRYYSQEDIKEIVHYAAERYIEIVPEIDMPGHATAANRAYPQFSGGGNEAHPEFTFNPGKEEIYGYLSDILRETDALFSSQMIHFGGDEVSFGTDKWLSDPDVSKLMKDKKLADLKAVEFYFNRRIGDTISRLGNKIMAWDEAVEAGLPVDNTTIFWWRHDKPEQLQKALKKGYPIVLCPRLPLYFDFVQDSTHVYGRRWQGRFNTLEQVYSFSAENLLADKGKRKQICGIQANLWTETVGSGDRLDFLLFPRIAALAEAAWTDKPNKDYTDFCRRLNEDMRLFREEHIYYFNPAQVNMHSEPSPAQRLK